MSFINNNFKKLDLIFLLITLIIYYGNNFNIFFVNDPLVSIIIPINHNFSFIFNCLDSLLPEESFISTEIIIISNFSFNISESLAGGKLKKYRNINIIGNNDINDYYKNCNLGAKFSQGKYLLFLKDNMKYNKDSLTFLIKQFDRDKNIGMIGSKIINNDGKLNEAGGIIWNNGDFINFGYGNDVDLPEYNYVKEVDYIPEGSMIIKKYIFQRTGGFDERFLNDYKNIDLAFKVRKCGFKVIYQPKSIIEQNEEISKRIDIMPIMKNNNKQLFINKWKNELKCQLDQEKIFIARDRGFNKKRIFVIDGFVPYYDKDAGSRCSFMYLNIFKEIGFLVTFLASDLIKEEPYTTILQQKGIEVLYGYKLDIKNWIQDNIKYFDYVYVQRPDVTIKYINMIKNNYSGKIIYFTHDLHHIRLYRQYIITHNKEKYTESIKLEKIEKQIFSKVDVIYVVGSYEFKILKDKLKNKIIRNIPLYIYETQYNNVERDFSKRKDIIFVGGMHDTNIDAVIWFSKEIYPKIIKKFPDLVWHIVTSKGENIIKQLESKNIKIEYKLTDKELQNLYQKCRLAIAPLRFGAGVKGKIIEAAYYQIPMVTTSIGAEGLDSSIGSFVIVNNADEMAKIICQLYMDFNKLKKMSHSGKILIEKYFSKKLAKEIILKDFK